jgi:hypothetical protein
LESEDFAAALALEAQRDRIVQGSSRYARPHAYFSRGLYADLLATYFGHFPRSQVLVLRQEDAVRDPHALAVTLHAFLGVEPRPQDADGLGTLNAAADSQPLDPAIRRQLEARYAEPNRRLAALLGPDFEIWPPGPAQPEPAGARR